MRRNATTDLHADTIINVAMKYGFSDWQKARIVSKMLIAEARKKQKVPIIIEDHNGADSDYAALPQ